MINLIKKESPDDFILSELTKAGIPTQLGRKVRKEGIEYSITGRLSGWVFERRPTSWLARAEGLSGMPIKLAKRLHGKVYPKNYGRGKLTYGNFVFPSLGDPDFAVRYFRREDGIPVEIETENNNRGIMTRLIENGSLIPDTLDSVVFVKEIDLEKHEGVINDYIVVTQRALNELATFIRIY